MNMTKFRSMLFVLFLVVTVIPWATFVVLMSIFVRGDRVYWVCAAWLRLAIRGAKVICGVRSRVTGMENLPNGPAVLASKHQSTWETFAYPALLPRPLSYVFKRELLYIPFFGWAMARLDMIHIDRSKRAAAWAKVAEQGRQFLATGHWVIMFPEGTRTPRGSQGMYKGGAARLAVTLEAPIVPIAVTSARCWPRKSFLLYPGVVDVSIGAPIPTAGRDTNAVMHEVEHWIETEMRRLDGEAYPTSTLTPTFATTGVSELDEMLAAPETQAPSAAAASVVEPSAATDPALAAAPVEAQPAASTSTSESAEAKTTTATATALEPVEHADAAPAATESSAETTGKPSISAPTSASN